ncbi:MAG: P-loop NTPase [Deltaproteobacteria bacterium]|nr:P-loop NTPase [Deltaproteobacteria bacterium]MBW1962201.1 P-loop NTPase [Deltaproteobacteria bacterium]MBW2152850.1 P-loop NTPase [Deltaproteobacteria bacterium]
MKNEGHCSDKQHKDLERQKQDAAIRDRLAHIKNKILVMSGKGGVGKSSIAAYLSVYLAKKGYRVGLMDVDLHGPSIPRLLGLRGNILPAQKVGKALPIRFMPNLEVISIESLMGENKDLATIWRGPVKIGVIRQFIADIEWSDLDYLIIDSPPGTGDEPLTVAQTIPDATAIIVTTPQEISLADVRKSINFCRQVHMRILGLVENMSGLICPCCGKRIDLFKKGGGLLTAKKENIPLLASLPIEPEVVDQADGGTLEKMIDSSSAFNNEFQKMVDTIIQMMTTNITVSKRIVQEPKGIDRNGKVVFAIPIADGKLCSHFGHCENFALIETENGKIIGKTLHTPPPHEPGVLPRWLQQMGARIVIAGGMGSRAQQLFEEKGIEVITGAPIDEPESLVHQYLEGRLITGANVCDH